MVAIADNNENGKVKRVMFEGGYATFDASGVPGWHYFVPDRAVCAHIARRV